MTRTVRNVVLATALVAATGTAFAARQGAVRNPFSVSMFADASSAQSFMGTLEFKITNNSNETVRVPYWQLPGATAENKLFKIFRNGKVADYFGPMIKRSAPTDADLVTFRPYETKVVVVDLAESYDLGKTGEYTVSFASVLQGAKTNKGLALADSNGRMASLQSVPLKLWVDADGALRALKAGASGKGKPGTGGGGGTVVEGVSFVGCDSTQISRAGAAVVDARGYTENAKGYLAAGTAGARYTTWMGTVTTSRYNTVRSNFVAIDTAMDQSGGQIKINCGCNQSYYAYVYPGSAYEIFVCRAFWSAPATGTDSKAGTLVHEMSHFNVVAGTDDVVYGQTGAKSLAISDPNKAITNADSHEYFAENTPYQP